MSFLHDALIGADSGDAEAAVLFALPPTDTVFSGQFSSAVQAFQQAYNTSGVGSAITVDGRYGPQTATAMQHFISPGRILPPIPFHGGGNVTLTSVGSLGAAAPGQFLPSVLAAFGKFTEQLEGKVPYFYQDSATVTAPKCGWVTTGLGNKVDPLTEEVYGYGWTVDGRPATRAEILSSWQAVKANADPNLTSVHAELIPGNIVRLPESAIATLGAQKAHAFAATLASQYPAILSWPADAQMGILGVAWGTGPSISSVSWLAAFNAAVAAGDFGAMAAIASRFGPSPAYSGTWKNITDQRRSALNLLFSNAAETASKGADYTFLNWPVHVTLGQALKGSAQAAGFGLGTYVIGGVLFVAVLSLVRALASNPSPAQPPAPPPSATGH